MKKRSNLHRLFSLALSCFLIAGVHAQNRDAEAPNTKKMLIVLLAGQSNMAGRGAYSQLSPADTVTYPNILSLNKSNVWVRAKHPLHWDKSEAAVGMGISFARELVKKLGGDVTVGLVPCAAGGTNIDGWLNDEYFAFTGNFNLYTNFITRANKAAESGEIIGMLWHQGEANASSANYATYKDKLLTLFTKMRTDLNLPDMPIVSGELGGYLSYTYLNEINAIINNLSDDLPNYSVASAAGLMPNSDVIHFTATSQVELGKRYAEAFYPIYTHSPATLTSLVLSSGTLSPAFNPDITEYICYLPAGIISVTGDLTTSYTGAKVTVSETEDISSGSATTTIVVTSLDGVTTKTYTINFVTGSGTDYTNLVINNDFELAPDAAGNPVPVAAGINGWDNSAWRPKSSTGKQFYGWNCDLSLTGSSTSQGINANPDGNRHGDWVCWIGGNRTAYTEFEFSQTIDKNSLPAGTYKVQCLLAAGNGNKKNSQRLFANNSVQYYGVSADYDKNLATGEKYTFAGHTLFTDNVMYEMTVYVTINEDDSLKIGVRTGNKLTNGTVPVQQSPMFKVDYFRLTKIDDTRAADASLANISLSAGNLDFLPETTVYNVTLPKGTEVVTATATANIQDATVTGAEAVNMSSGAGVSTIVVTALDGTTTKTYTINYTVETGEGIHDVNTKDAKITYSVTNRKLTVKGTAAYSVYSLNGIKVAGVKTNLPETSVDLLPGLYIVKTTGSEVFKVIVR
jgi:hypothetical protein